MQDVAESILDYATSDGVDISTRVEMNFTWSKKPNKEDLIQAIVDDSEQAIKNTGFKICEISEPVFLLLDMMQDAGIPSEAIVMPNLNIK